MKFEKKIKFEIGDILIPYVMGRRLDCYMILRPEPKVPPSIQEVNFYLVLKGEKIELLGIPNSTNGLDPSVHYEIFRSKTKTIEKFYWNGK